MTTRTAIVTGGARGIGAGICKRLAADGISVAVVDLQQDDADAVAAEITSEGGTAAGFAIDVSDSDAVTAGVEAIADKLSAPTILVNNAGILRDNLLFKMSVDDWDTVMAVHLRGSFLMTKATQKHMVDAKYGRIVNLSSTSAQGNRGQANYAAAKAGVQGFTKTLAIELGKYGITTNAIAPGLIETDMTHATAERIGISWDDFVNFNLQNIPVARIGQPEDIAHTVSYLVSEGAGFVNGQVIYVAGGPQD